MKESENSFPFKQKTHILSFNLCLDTSEYCISYMRWEKSIESNAVFEVKMEIDILRGTGTCHMKSYIQITSLKSSHVADPQFD